ncbi:MAG TPA: RNA methyltransferase, partial [Deltaproteobacteria bacterium]|nr:RNA methyltransferase [Deltaproteobacteria bacterium]
MLGPASTHGGGVVRTANPDPISDMSRSSNPTRRRSGQKTAARPGSWLTGFHSVREALRARRRPLERLVLGTQGGRAGDRELIDLARAAGIPIERIEAREFDLRIDGADQGQGVALRVGPLPELSLRQLLDQSGEADDAGTGTRLVLLDGVEDPQNVGALARVAEGAGVRGLILSQRRAPPLSPAVSRASAGAIEWLPVARVPNLGRAIRDLKQGGFWVVAAAPSTGGSLFGLADRILSGNLVVVLGAEGKGIRPSVLELADHRAAIPMRGQI